MKNLYPLPSFNFTYKMVDAMNKTEENLTKEIKE